MCTRGVWQLKEVCIQYSETGHSSRGLRFYFRHLLGKWQEKNPQVEVRTLHRQFEEPHVIFEYKSKERHSVPLKDLMPRQIEDVLNLFRNSESSNAYLRHGGPKVWTLRRSIQGLWQPSLEGQLQALQPLQRKRHKKDYVRLPKYSQESIKLSLEAIRGYGRWGSEREFSKGWDQFRLRQAFSHPFIDLN